MPRSVSTLSDAQLERKRANDREAQRLIRQRTRKHIENLERQVAEKDQRYSELERQVAELSKEKDQALQRNSELEAQITTLERQITHMLLQGSQSIVGPGHIGIAPAYGTNNYIIPKILSKRNANRGVGQYTTIYPMHAGKAPSPGQSGISAEMAMGSCPLGQY
jgi:septal ring factor EnvC (AmiA/AmiB activator)